MPPGGSTPTDPAALQDAAEWFARLSDSSLDRETEAQWREWVQASPANQHAWARVEAIDNRIRALDSPPAKAALNAPGIGRRRMLKMLVLAGVGLPLAGHLGWRMSRPWRADYATAVGDIRQLTLADGTHLWLNTGTAVNVTYDDQSRIIKLLHGEVAIRTAADPRPLLLDTPVGQVQPLGTWFNVQQQQDHADVSVYHGRVAVRPAQSDQESVIDARHQARFTRNTVTVSSPLEQDRPTWTQGILVTDGMRLDEVIHELSRYRRGYLGVAPEVANLRLVGAFPLQDTDRVLAAIEQSLPVNVVQLTPWWVRLQPQ